MIGSELSLKLGIVRSIKMPHAFLTEQNPPPTHTWTIPSCYTSIWTRIEVCIDAGDFTPPNGKCGIISANSHHKICLRVCFMGKAAELEWAHSPGTTLYTNYLHEWMCGGARSTLPAGDENLLLVTELCAFPVHLTVLCRPSDWVMSRSVTS